MSNQNTANFYSETLNNIGRKSINDKNFLYSYAKQQVMVEFVWNFRYHIPSGENIIKYLKSSHLWLPYFATLFIYANILTQVSTPTRKHR